MVFELDLFRRNSIYIFLPPYKLSIKYIYTFFFTVVSQSTSLSVSVSSKTMHIHILTAPENVNGSFLAGDGSLTSTGRKQQNRKPITFV